VSRRGYAPFACVDCDKEGPAVDMCRIRKIQFAPFGDRCPREGPEQPTVIAKDVAGDQYLEIPLELIYWKDPIRKDILEKDVNDMATSFSCHGQIEPIVVTGPDEEGKYEGICGRLRYEAMKRFRNRPILARVHQFKSEREKIEWKLAENLHRRSLTFMQKVEAYRQLYEMHRDESGKVYGEQVVNSLAKRLEELTGEKQAEKTIYEYIRASYLPEKVREISERSENFGIGHATQLMRLKNHPDKQLEAAKKIVEEGLTVRKLKEFVDSIVEPEEKSKPKEHATCPVCGAKLSDRRWLQLREEYADLPIWERNKP